MSETGAFFEDLSAKTPIECHFYNKGFCRYADKCTFLHIDKNIYPSRGKHANKIAATITTSTKKQEDHQSLQSNKLCIFFFRGKCKAQSSCPFLHSYPSVEYARNAPDSKGTPVQTLSTTQDVLLMETGDNESSATPGKRKRTGIESDISEDTSITSPTKIAADVSCILDKYSTSKQIAAIAASKDIVIVKGRHKN